jgi:lysophospholipase L1-like esterase
MLARLDHSVPPGTGIVIVQGGYNDLLARRTAAELLASIQGIVARLAQRHIKTVLCGYYNSGWDAVGRSVARRYGAVFVDGSSCCEGKYRSLDGLHMNAAGYEVVARRLFPVIARLLSRPTTSASATERR